MSDGAVEIHGNLVGVRGRCWPTPAGHTVEIRIL